MVYSQGFFGAVRGEHCQQYLGGFGVSFLERRDGIIVGQLIEVDRRWLWLDRGCRRELCGAAICIRLNGGSGFGQRRFRPRFGNALAGREQCDGK